MRQASSKTTRRTHPPTSAGQAASHDRHNTRRKKNHQKKTTPSRSCHEQLPKVRTILLRNALVALAMSQPYLTGLRHKHSGHQHPRPLRSPCPTKNNHTATVRAKSPHLAPLSPTLPRAALPLSPSHRLSRARAPPPLQPTVPSLSPDQSRFGPAPPCGCIWYPGRWAWRSGLSVQRTLQGQHLACPPLRLNVVWGSPGAGSVCRLQRGSGVEEPQCPGVGGGWVMGGAVLGKEGVGERDRARGNLHHTVPSGAQDPATPWPMTGMMVLPPYTSPPLPQASWTLLTPSAKDNRAALQRGFADRGEVKVWTGGA